MTTRDLDKFFKKASKVIDNYEGKLKILDYDYFIISNVIYNYNDLTYTQLCYLDSLDDRHLNKEEISSIIFKRQLDIF